jgi:hypothetical protein
MSVGEYLQTSRWRRMERWYTSRMARQRGHGAGWYGWTVKAGRRPCPHRRVPTSIHGPISGPVDGHVVAIPQVGGLHHRYEWQAA